MTTSPSLNAGGLSLGVYLKRLNQLEASLREHPDQSDAWRRHIQLKVMKFVASRYADGALFDLSRLDESPCPQSRPSMQPFYARSPDRTLADLLPILQRISEANRR